MENIISLNSWSQFAFHFERRLKYGFAIGISKQSVSYYETHEEFWSTAAAISTMLLEKQFSYARTTRTTYPVAPDGVSEPCSEVLCRIQIQVRGCNALRIRCPFAFAWMYGLVQATPNVKRVQIE